MSKEWLARALAILVTAALPVVVHAQAANPGVPSDFSRNPHPAMPWAGYSNPNMGGFDYGQAIRYIPVPPQQVEIEVPVSVPEGVPARTQKQVQEIPGYYVTETTTGFYYPERWALQQLNVGVYQWVKMPGEFRRK
jgi:hypothetical protein